MTESDYKKYNDGGYKAYISSIKNIPRISKKEEVELSKTIMANEDSDAVKKAIDKLTVSNLLLVVKYATKYHNKFGANRFDYRINLMDLIEEGNLGLMRAAKTFDYTRSGFSTYATYFIKKEMSRAANEFRFIRIPSNHHTITNKIRKIKEKDLEITHEIKKEIAKECDVSVNQVNFALKCEKIQVTGFDNFKIRDEEDSLNFLDFYVDENAPDKTEAESNEDKNYLLLKIYTLSQIEQEAIFIRFFGDDPVSCEDMAEIWGISKQRISQILIGALKKLRFRIEADRREEI